MKNNLNCLNCGEQLTKDQHYCPNCGQENSEKNLPLGEFLKDFFSNTLGFDTIITKTINPFLFRPGKLTKAFNEGKRRRYINPIRLYLIFSLFYFFMISLTVPKNFIDKNIRSIFNQKEVLDSVVGTKLDSASLETLNNADLDMKIKSTKVKQDSLISDKKGDRWATLKYWASDESLSDAEFSQKLKDIGLDLTAVFDLAIVRGFIKNSSIFTYQAVKNLPLMMFFFLPVFALILKILFFKKWFYVEHLIHGLHLHAFAYFIYGMAILLISLFPINEGWLIFLSFIWVSSYTLLSIKKLYGNGWFKSLLKFFTLGLFYFILLLFGALFELYISLLTI